MSKNMPQIALDFGPEPGPPPQQGESGERTDHLNRQYMSAGVGVRIKSLKSPKTATGDLFGNAEAAEVKMDAAAGEPVPAEPLAATAPLREEPLPAAEAATVSIENRKAMTPRRTERVARTVTTAPNAVKSKRGRKSLKQVAAEADLIEIPADDVLFSKQYYTMGEVAEMFRVNQSLLRFWETEFDILQPRKNKKGDRYFRPVDIKNLHLIYHLLRQRKYTIEGAKDFLKKNKKAEERFEAIQRLQEIRAFLQEWKAHVNF
jgi:DNA-binding transcriptional MerR regulator